MDKYNILGIVYRLFAKPVFFLFDPEFIHNRVASFGSLLGKTAIGRAITWGLFEYRDPALEQNIAGLNLKNPIGLSAGFDKNAELINVLPNVGFGFAEIGSATLNPYEGNPKPRLFRLKQSKGLVVYYGLKNIGIHKILQRIESSLKQQMIVGLSIAKTNCKETSSLEGGIEDYHQCFKVADTSNKIDYYTINISCPNTFGGEPFTTQDKLEKLLKRLSELNINKPVFVKMPINLDLNEYDSLVKTCIKYNIAGVIIGNLTKVRDPLLIKDEIPEHIKGGISGLPTQQLSNELIAYTYKKYGEKLVIIGVGGIFNAEDAYRKIKLGASAVQLITGMIFEGPQLIGRINKQLVAMLKDDGYSNISEAIGTENYVQKH